MKFSGSSLDTDPVRTTEGSLSGKETDDGGLDESSEECGPEENIVLQVAEASVKCDVGSINLSLPSNEATDELLGTSLPRNLPIEPELGMAFHSENGAFVFYNRYAFKKGFSVRKGHLGRRTDGTIRDRIFLCSNEGTRQKHRTHETKKPRANVRTNCLARIEFKVSHGQLWIVNKVIYDHNHPLTPPTNAHLLRSHRKFMVVQEDIDDMADVRVSNATKYDISAEEAHNNGVMPLIKDHNTYLHIDRIRVMEKGDAQVLLDFLKSRKLEDPSFFYSVQLDVNDRVTNFLWADARSIIDYSYFGDVVTLDTTYRASKNNVPFAPFIGVNHHKHIVVFACAWMLDETTESFIWLFKNFMAAMSGRQPKTIFTDQCAAMSRAISVVIPNTNHRYCLWHVLHNSTEHISHTCSSEPHFQKEFKSCIYESSLEENFDAVWENLISKYDLVNNSWLEELYSTRDKWALVYRKDSFCAIMASMQWGEHMKHYLRKYFNRKLPLSKFLEQYNKSLVQFREKELSEDYQSRQTKPILLVDVPMLNEAAESYTRVLYMDFEHEFKSQLLSICEPVGTDGTVHSFRVSLPTKHHFGLVKFDATNVMVTCSCKMFETMGILCMHCLKVLNNNNILHLPSHYIVKRWTKYANDGMPFGRYQSSSNGHEPMILHYSRVCQKTITIATKCAFSEDALELFEHELDKLAEEVENILHNVPSKEQGILKEDMQRNMFKTAKRVKVQREQMKYVERERKRRSISNPDLSCTCIRLSSQVGKNNETSIQLMVSDNDSLHVPPDLRDGAISYSDSIPVQSCGTSRCMSSHPAMSMATQETFLPSQSKYDHTISPQGTSSLNLMLSRGPTGVSVPFMPGQLNTISWAIPMNGLNGDMPQSRPEQSV